MDVRVIKEDDYFLITDKNGDIEPAAQSGQGFYSKDTRFLSRMELLINEQKPILLSSEADKNYKATILLTNPHMEKDGRVILWRDSIQIRRDRFISQGVLYEQVKLKNYFPKKVEFSISFHFDADFQDMFIVRGFQTGRTGNKSGVDTHSRKMEISYIGADKVKRVTRILWDMDAEVVEEGKLSFPLQLESQEEIVITFTIAPIIDGKEPVLRPVDQALAELHQSYDKWRQNSTQIESDHDLFNQVVDRGIQDLRVLLTDLGYGPFPVAGVPWFAVPFGRDSLITALQMLPLNPSIAKGTLLTMASYQGEKVDPWRDEQPGKIMHEIRYGELANTNQIPFSPYYGSVDATPLFLVLAVEYFHWTNDLETIHQLLPNIERAIKWLNQYGDRDGDGFIEYYQESSKGIANQGWKDSGDSIIHENGEYAKAPIALVEVQGYVYQAKSKLVPIMRLLGKEALANQLEEEAQQLKAKFNHSFWMPEHKFYAIALDHEKKMVKSVTSNPGHVLMSGILDHENAKHIANRLLSPDMFSGFGIRTMSTQSTGYNPMSYHDGSVWPHDNSMILLGFVTMGFKEEASTIIEGLLKAASGFEYYRLPELFCGYDDTIGYPVPYPVACSPQAWAAGSAIVFLQSILGLQPDAICKRITINPFLPAGMNLLVVRNLRIGNGFLELLVKRKDHDVEVQILSNSTGFEVQHWDQVQKHFP